MATNKKTIKSEIKTFIDELNSDPTGSNPDETIDTFAEKLAEVIQNAILSASVTCTIPAGAVSTGISPTVILLPAPLSLSGNLT